MAGVPQSLRPIGHYIKIANEFRERDPAVYYWCLLYAVQTGMTMKLDKSSPEAKQYFINLLDTLEQVKKALKGMETVSQEIVAQAHIEEVALKLFAHADTKDRESDFSKNTIRAFYTSGHLLDVLNLFGEVDEKVQEARKYAKWKCAYLNMCAKSGETPMAGPPPAEGEEQSSDGMGGPTIAVPPAAASSSDNKPPPRPMAPAARDNNEPPAPVMMPGELLVSPDAFTQKNARSRTGAAKSDLTPEQWEDARRLCKYAMSAIQYEDGPAAVDNLSKAIRLLTVQK